VLVNFYKYHGAGNDFIIIDARKIDLSIFTTDRIADLCNRRLGIGADGLMLLNNCDISDFSMKYYNSDGKEGSMCGNGGRCIAYFAYNLGVSNKKGCFSAIDGLHDFEIVNDSEVNLLMSDVNSFYVLSDGYFVNTGSPHFVMFYDDISGIDVNIEGKRIRNDKRFSPLGLNANFVCINNNVLHIRTYERGVENETLACGTGAVAAAISYCLKTEKKLNEYTIIAKGGILNVSFNKEDETYKNIWLRGPVQIVYKGELVL